MANFFITGANGFVGQKLIKYLLDSYHTPIALVKDLNRKTDQKVRERLIEKGAEIRGSILDKDLIRTVINKYEIDYVIHLAACPIVKQCDSDPWTAYNVNIMGSVVLFEAIRDELNRNNRIRKIISMSTDKSYGNSSPPGGYLENTPFEITDTYCTSKACGDMIARSYAKTYGLPICVVRCGNLYGGGDLNLSRLIPGTTLRLLNGEQPILYSDAKEMTREFVHIQDLISAYMILLEKGVDGEAYNIGTGILFKIEDVIKKICDHVNKDLEIKIIKRNLFEIKEQMLNANKIKSLGWNATISLDEGLNEAIPWYKSWYQKHN